MSGTRFLSFYNPLWYLTVHQANWILKYIRNGIKEILYHIKSVIDSFSQRNLFYPNYCEITEFPPKWKIQV